MSTPRFANLHRPLTMPSAVHETLGQTQTPASLLAVVAAILAAALLWWWLPGPATVEPLPFWRQALAFVLFLDIAAGAVANLTTGTDRFYATRPRHRWVFIAIHLHLPAVGWLLAAPMAGYWAVWALTITGAIVVNLLRGNRLQPVMAGLVLCLGILLMPVLGHLLDLDPLGQTVSLLFLFKVTYSFAVSHHAPAQEAQDQAAHQIAPDTQDPETD